MSTQITGVLASKRTLLKALLFLLVFSALFIAFVPVKAQIVPKVSDKVLKDTTIRGKVFQLKLGRRGGRYIEITPASGKTYKKYPENAKALTIHTFMLNGFKYGWNSSIKHFIKL